MDCPSTCASRWVCPRKIGPSWPRSNRRSDADTVLPIGKLVVVGVGLIGGSFALAMKRSGDADLVFLATPVGQMRSLFAAIAPHLGTQTLITDAGSTKQDVVAAARTHLGPSLPRFVPGHPIAGTEHSGATAAFDALFRDKQVVLTPLPETDAAALARVAECWRRCGATVRRLDAARHDAILSAVSHLPHALAFALIADLAARPDADECFDLAGTGLRDFTRLASSHPDTWRDICLANRDALRRDLATYRNQLQRIDALLDARDGEALRALFARAHSVRDA